MALVATTTASLWLALLVASAKAAGFSPLAPVSWAIVAALLLVPTVLLAVARHPARRGLPKLVTSSGMMACLITSLTGIQLGLQLDGVTDVSVRPCASRALSIDWLRGWQRVIV